MQKRFNNLSLYRILVAVSLIFFHFFYYTAPERIDALEILSLQVAGFSALSGFLFSQKKIEFAKSGAAKSGDAKGFYQKNIKKILLPALVVAGAIVVIDLVLVLILKPATWANVFWSSDNARGSFALQIGNFWYLPYILLCYLITPLLQKESNKKSGWVWIALALALEYIVYWLGSVRLQILPYIIGYYIGTKRFEAYNECTKKTWPRALIWLLIGVAGWLLRLFFCGFEGNNLVRAVAPVADTAIGVASLFCFINAFNFLNKQSGIKFFTYTDRWAFFIYLNNLFLFCGITNIANTIFSAPVQCALCVVIVLVLSVFEEKILSLITTRRVTP